MLRACKKHREGSAAPREVDAILSLGAQDNAKVTDQLRGSKSGQGSMRAG
jgi:hypothetical protein